MTVSMCCISPGQAQSCGLWLEIGLIFGIMFKICPKLFLRLEDSSLCLIHRIELLLVFPSGIARLLYPTTHFHNKGLQDHLPTARFSWICPKRQGEGTTREPYISTLSESATSSPLWNQTENQEISMRWKFCQGWKKKHSISSDMVECNFFLKNRLF